MKGCLNIQLKAKEKYKVGRLIVAEGHFPNLLSVKTYYLCCPNKDYEVLQYNY
jgi:hypothetical protein